MFVEESVAQDEWNYIAVTYDYDAGMATAYVNGQEVGSLDVGQREIATQGTAYVGAAGNGLNHFTGDIACVQIFNKALTPEEIVDNDECPIGNILLSYYYCIIYHNA